MVIKATHKLEKFHFYCAYNSHRIVVLQLTEKMCIFILIHIIHTQRFSLTVHWKTFTFLKKIFIVVDWIGNQSFAWKKFFLRVSFCFFSRSLRRIMHITQFLLLFLLYLSFQRRLMDRTQFWLDSSFVQRSEITIRVVLHYIWLDLYLGMGETLQIEAY